MSDLSKYLQPSALLDFNHEAFDTFTQSIQADLPEKERAIQLYFLVRDAFRYDPYHLDITENGLKTSNVLQKKRAWCVEKAAVLAAVARKFGIPSRLGYAIVTNHIGIEKLLSYLKRDEIVFHGYTELFVDGKWIKCTPAFDLSVCKKANVEPLNWDGQTDSMFQEYENGKRFMEYLHDYGNFDDIPVQLMNAEMRNYYPHLFDVKHDDPAFSFKHL